jgi:GTP-binding protein EngB required for normal cell division
MRKLQCRWHTASGGAMIYRVMFSATHQRYLLSSFRSIDKLLSEALANLRADDDGRLFATHTPDATESQRQVLSDYVAQLRFILRRFLQARAFSDMHRSVGALWSFRVAINFAAITVEELRPSYLRGYGNIDPESEAAIERLASDLKVLLRRMARYLDHGEGAGLGARLAQLETTVDEIELLREIDRTISSHGLIELRTPLEQLVKRAASPYLEVAVFGRVNSGKTSLLNWWLGQPLLPTGVTPMTAVPTRILRGEIPQARVTTISAAPLDIPVDQLRPYLTEDHNPSNTKGVLEVEIRIPATRLIDGLCLVDTPGLGSLATVGAAQTLEYLPRCDLGVLLIEAGGVIGREDVDVARAIVDSGGELVIALSKADRLSDTDLSRALEYARVQLTAKLNASFDVRAISTVPTHVALTEAWFRHEFHPRLAAHREHTARALRRKIGALLESVVALLQARLESDVAAKRGERTQAEHPGPETDPVSQVHAEIDRERRSLISIGLSHTDIDRIIGVASEELVRRWMTPSNDHAIVEAAVRASISNSAAGEADALAQRLRRFRTRLQDSLNALVNSSAPALELPTPHGRPLLDSAAVPLPPSLRRPRVLGVLRPLMRVEARRRLDQYARVSLKRQLAIYEDALRRWGTGYLDDLAAQYDSALALRAGVERAAAAGALDRNRAVVLESDLKRLQEWSEARSRSPGS